MDDAILITELNDFIFCPASIYFHKLYGGVDRMLYQSSDQINGTSAHEAIDGGTYSKDSNVLMATDVYCEKYGLIGKIDIYDNSTINAGMEGNTHLHEKQYAYNGIDIDRGIIHNKVYNQRMLLQSFRKKSDDVKDAINMLKNYESQLEATSELHQILGIEGNSAKVYFSRVFNNTRWRGRKPRVKFDYINSLLDIGYTLLFNFIDCILPVYGFDVYKGVLHTQFYMRKSLVCDLMEPFRPIIDWRVRIGINLGQFKENDFVQIKDQWQLEYKKTAEYANVFMTDILDNKETIFLYIRSYYRAFMKGKPAKDFPFYDIHSR